MHIGLFLGIYVGVFLEGEAILISAVIAAHHDHIPMIPVAITAYLAAVSADVFFYMVGRTNGAKWIAKHRTIQPKINKASKFLQRNEMMILLTYRFMYGFRSIIPLIAAMNGLSFGKFLLFSVTGSAVWAVSITALGVLTGEAIIRLLDHIHQVEFYFIGGLLAIGLVLGVYKYLSQIHRLIPTSWDELEEL